MIKKIFISFFALGFSGCLYSPAVSPKYDFGRVGEIHLKKINDHSNSFGSGEMIMSNLSHNFLKLGFDVTESELGSPLIKIGNGDQTLELSCIITEFTESEIVVVPYRHVDRGYTETTVGHSADADSKNKKSESSSSTKTTTHGGTVSQGSRIEYTQTQVAIMLKMRDIESGSLVWSNSYWYSGLELHRTIEICVKNAIHQLKKLLK